MTWLRAFTIMAFVLLNRQIAKDKFVFEHTQIGMSILGGMDEQVFRKLGGR